jgi:hypothetical protein
VLRHRLCGRSEDARKRAKRDGRRNTVAHTPVIHKLTAYVFADMIEEDDCKHLNRMDAVELCARCATDCVQHTDVVCVFEVAPEEAISCFICEGRRE